MQKLRHAHSKSPARLARGRGGTTGATQAGARYNLAIMSLFGSVALFTLFDLVTTIRGYAVGLSEGNYLLLSMAHILGAGTLLTLVAFKAAFILLAGVTVLIGEKSESSVTRKTALGVLALFAAVFLAVSLNNLVAIMR